MNNLIADLFSTKVTPSELSWVASTVSLGQVHDDNVTDNDEFGHHYDGYGNHNDDYGHHHNDYNFQIGGAVAGAWLGGALGRKATVLLSSGFSTT